MCRMNDIIAMNFISLLMLDAPLHAYFNILSWLLVLALCECVHCLRAGSLSAFEHLTVHLFANVCAAFEQVPSPPSSP
jgi:hypothetical protein